MKTKSRKGGNLGNLGNSLYDGAATFGVFMSTVYLIIGIIIGGLLIAGATYFFLKKQVYSASITSTVTNCVCNNNTTTDAKNNTQTTLECITTVTYTVNAKKITSNVRTGIKRYEIGDILTIYYNPSNPTDITDSPPNWKILGWILLVIGLLIIGGVILNYYIAHKYKFAAAASGVDTIF